MSDLEELKRELVEARAKEDAALIVIFVIGVANFFLALAACLQGGQ